MQFCFKLNPTQVKTPKRIIGQLLIQFSDDMQNETYKIQLCNFSDNDFKIEFYL